MNAIADLDTPLALSPAARLRSGTAARLAGVPVATLRVWERRYAVVAAPKTPTGQRLYSAHDVQRLRLLRLLTEAGHGIGTIASLGLPALQALSSGIAPEEAALSRRIVVVGRATLQRLRSLPGTQVLAVHDDLPQAEAALHLGAAAGLPTAVGPADLLVVQLASLPTDAADRVAALRHHWRATSVLVLYAFGAESTIDALRRRSMMVRREPLAAGDLVRLVAAATPSAPGADGAGATDDATAAALRIPPAPRRFSDEALAALAELPSNVACECPRHLAEIVQQMVAFERYSADCLNSNPADAALHRALQGLAAAARTIFEEAVARVVAAEGLDLPGQALA